MAFPSIQKENIGYIYLAATPTKIRVSKHNIEIPYLSCRNDIEEYLYLCLFFSKPAGEQECGFFQHFSIDIEIMDDQNTNLN